MAEKSKENRASFHPHGNNIDTKIKKGTTCLIDFKEQYYQPFVKSMSKIDFKTGNINQFEKAAHLINNYYAKLSECVKNNNIDTRSGIKSSFIEEISKYLFYKHPVIIKEKLLFFNADICTGLFFSKDSIKTTNKNVDFCICREKTIKMGKDKFSVRIPIISVECKTYLDGTMFNEVIDTATRLHTSSPDSANFVLMLWSAVGKDTFTTRRKSTNVYEFFSLMKKPNNKEEEINIHIDPKVLMAYYNTVSKALEEYFTDYNYPEYGAYLH